MAKVAPAHHRPRSDGLGPKVNAHTRYFLADGTLVPGVTTVVGVLGFNKDVLVRWANNEGLRGRDTSKIKDETAAIGTLAHYLIQCELAAITPDLRDFTPAQLDLAQHAVRSFHQWRAQHDLRVVLVEQPLVSERHRYGGTVDCYATVNGVPTLLDFKTSSGIWLEHKIQVSAYWRLLTEHHHPVRGVRILRIPRVPEEEFHEVHLTGSQVLIGWKMFEHALELWRLHRELTRWK